MTPFSRSLLRFFFTFKPNFLVQNCTHLQHNDKFFDWLFIFDLYSVLVECLLIKDITFPMVVANFSSEYREKGSPKNGYLCNKLGKF